MAVLIAVTLLLYSPVGDHGFVNYDDDIYVYENERVSNGLTPDNIGWAFTGSFEMGNWDPLNWLSHMAAAHFFGLEPAAHHWVSVLIHVANSTLLFLFFWRVVGCSRIAFLAAAVFAWHPLQVETVAWVAERKGVLSAFFWLLGMALYVRYAERPTKSRLAAVFVAFAMGLMSKPALMTFPFALLLLDIWPLRRTRPGEWRLPRAWFSKLDDDGRVESVPYRRASPGELLREKAAMFAVVLAWVFVAHGAQSAVGAVGGETVSPLAGRLANVPVSYFRHLLHFVWPSGLIPFYPHPGVWPWSQVAGSLIFLGVITAAVLRQLGRRPFLAVGWFWFLGVLVPMIQIVQIGSHAMADRYFYLPMIGVLIAFVGGFAAVRKPGEMVYGPASVVACFALVGCLWMTHRQISRWKNTETLFSWTVEVSPENHVAHNNLGVDYMNRGLHGPAAERLAESIRLSPSQPEARYNLGTLLSLAGNLPAAIEQFKAALKLDPDYAKAHSNLGEALARTGRLEEALASYEAALALFPDDAKTLNNLGNLLLRLGRVAEAAEKIGAAIRMDPSGFESLYNLGRVYQAARRPELAVQSYRSALALKPGDAAVWNNLANALVDLGKRSDALTAYRQSLELDPDRFDTRVNLAMTLEEDGAIKAAVREYREALALQPRHVQALSLLGGALSAQGSYADAEKALREALAMAPKNGVTMNGLARLLASAPREGIRNGAEALRLAQEAVESTGGARGDYLGTLAAAHAELGDFERAVEIVERALSAASNSGDPGQTDELKTMLQLFRSGRPYRLRPR